jgi:hypothetical protein
MANLRIAAMVNLPTAEESPTVKLWPTAAHAVGVQSKDGAYRLGAKGELCPGVPIWRIGGRFRVPTAALRRVLQLDDPAA